MKEKSKVGMLVAMAKNQFGNGVKVVRSDNGLKLKVTP